MRYEGKTKRPPKEPICLSESAVHDCFGHGADDEVREVLIPLPCFGFLFIFESNRSLRTGSTSSLRIRFRTGEWWGFAQESVPRSILYGSQSREGDGHHAGGSLRITLPRPVVHKVGGGVGGRNERKRSKMTITLSA